MSDQLLLSHYQSLHRLAERTQELASAQQDIVTTKYNETKLEESLKIAEDKLTQLANQHEQQTTSLHCIQAAHQELTLSFESLSQSHKDMQDTNQRATQDLECALIQSRASESSLKNLFSEQMTQSSTASQNLASTLSLIETEKSRLREELERTIADLESFRV